MIKPKINYLYECIFKSSKGTRTLLVCSDCFGRAASLANSMASDWDDVEAYELYAVSIRDVVVVNS